MQAHHFHSEMNSFCDRIATLYSNWHIPVFPELHSLSRAMSHRVENQVKKTQRYDNKSIIWDCMNPSLLTTLWNIHNLENHEHYPRIQYVWHYGIVIQDETLPALRRLRLNSMKRWKQICAFWTAVGYECDGGMPGCIPSTFQWYSSEWYPGHKVCDVIGLLYILSRNPLVLRSWIIDASLYAWNSLTVCSRTLLDPSNLCSRRQDFDGWPRSNKSDPAVFSD